MAYALLSVGRNELQKLCQVGDMKKPVRNNYASVYNHNAMQLVTCDHVVEFDLILVNIISQCILNILCA